MSKILIYGIVVQLSVYSLVFAIDGRAQNKSVNEIEVSFNMKNPAKLNRILESIERSTEFDFSHIDQELNTSAYIIDVETKNVTLGDLLLNIASQTDLSFHRVNNYIQIRKKEVGVEPVVEEVRVEKTITGKVTDENGEGLPGATIQEKGTTNGTITDVDGNFLLDVPDDAVLTVSFVGFKTQEISINGRSMIDVQMMEDSEQLDEVVVIGFGNQKKVSVTGAISGIGTEKLLLGPVSNISSALGGKIPGLLSMQRNGDPGSDETILRIRGIGTFAGEQGALILIDGVPSTSLNSLDPNEIENISILKDASATAVYGVRGANGVVLVTTKRGEIGKPTFSLSSNVGINMFTDIRDRMDGEHWARYLQDQQLYDSYVTNSFQQLFTEEDYQLYKDGTDPIWHPNVDWIELMLRDQAFQQQHNVNISGGTPDVKYFVSAGFFDQAGLWNSENTKLFDGYAPNNDVQLRYKRYNIRSNFDFSVTERLSLVVNISSQFEQRNGPSSSSDLGSAAGMIRSLYLANPIAVPGVYDGKLVNTTDTRFGSMNPIAAFYYTGYQNEFRTNLNGIIRANYELDFITEGLSLRGTISYKNYNSVANNYSANFPTYIATHGYEGKTELLTTTPTVGNTKISSSGNKSRYAYTEVGLDYARAFEKHSFTGLLLYNQSKNNDPLLQYVVASGYQGLVGRVAYDFDNRYLAEFNFGYNGTENFAPGRRFGFFPAYSLGWVLSNEAFFPKNNIISLVKFRGSYGEVGNDKIGGNRFLYRPSSYSYYSGTNVYNFGIVGSTLSRYQGAREGIIGNPLVTWERSQKSNIGVNLTLLNDRIKITADIFQEKRDNILTSLNTVPYYVGALSNLPAVNVGKMENKGFDGDITYFGEAGDFTYTISANYTFAVNKILFQDEVPTPYSYREKTGQRYGQIYGLIDAGLFNSWEEVGDAYRPKSTYLANKLQPGDINLRDINGDGVIDNFDTAPIGYTNFPGKLFGLIGEVTYKNINLSFVAQGSSDVTFNAAAGNYILGAVNGQSDVPQYLENRWTLERYESGAQIDFNRADGIPASGNTRTSTFWTKDASYVRLKNVEFGYTLDNNKLIRSLNIEHFKVFVNASNLLTWAPGMKAFPGIDPENIVTGTNLEAYPVVKVINFGFNATF